ncbi:MAG: hypothetical protein Q7S21_07370 [archaeon]|nr:hypothetical protein [archaeon]
MNESVVRNAFREYLNNFRMALLFGILLVFVLFYVLFSNFFIQSGSIFVEPNLLTISPINLGIEMLAVGVFLLFYSIFVSFIIFNVRDSINHVRTQYYLSEKLHRFTFRLFAYYFVLTIFFFLLAGILVRFGWPLEAIALIELIISFALLFVPQSIVVDERSILLCVFHNFDYMINNPQIVLRVVIVSVILVLILPLIELAFDQFFFVGRWISLLIGLIFVIPFIEVLKTRAYMFKFGLVRPHL